MIAFFTNNSDNLDRYKKILSTSAGNLDRVKPALREIVRGAYYSNIPVFRGTGTLGLGLNLTSTPDMLSSIVRRKVVRIIGAGINGLVLEVEDGNGRSAMKLGRTDMRGEMYAQKRFYEVGLAPDVTGVGMFEWSGARYMYIMMELVDYTLYELLCAEIIPPRELAKSIVSLLKRMWEQGLTHGDMHPFNIGFRRREDPARLEPVLMDFGWADWTRHRPDLDPDQFMRVLVSHKYPHSTVFRKHMQEYLGATYTINEDAYMKNIRIYEGEASERHKNDTEFQDFMKGKLRLPPGNRVGVTGPPLASVEDAHIPYESKDGLITTFGGVSMSVPYNDVSSHVKDHINTRINVYDMLRRINTHLDKGQDAQEDVNKLKKMMNLIGDANIPPSLCIGLNSLDLRLGGTGSRLDCGKAFERLDEMFEEFVSQPVEQSSTYPDTGEAAKDYVHVGNSLLEYALPIPDHIFTPLFWSMTTPFKCPRDLDTARIADFKEFLRSRSRRDAAITNVGSVVESKIRSRVVPYDDISELLKERIRRGEAVRFVTDLGANGWMAVDLNTQKRVFIMWFTTSSGDGERIRDEVYKGVRRSVIFQTMRPTTPPSAASPHMPALFMLTYLANTSKLGTEPARTAVCDRMLQLPDQFLGTWLYYIGGETGQS